MFASGFKISCFFTLIIVISACSKEPLPGPSCRVNANYMSSHQGQGACIVRIGKHLLSLKLHNDVYNLPVSDIIPDQSAQCSAHHEMWLQTGLNVEVENVLGIQQNGTWLFGCKLDAGFDGTESAFSPAPWSKSSVKHISFIDPFSLDMHDWENVDQFIVVKDAFVAQGNYQKNNPPTEGNRSLE